MNIRHLIYKRLIEAAAPDAPPKAPPKAPPAPVKPKPGRREKPSPFNPPKPKQIPGPKNKKRSPFNPPRNPYIPEFKTINCLQQLMIEAYDDETDRSIRDFWGNITRNKEHRLGRHPIFALHGDRLSRSSWEHTSGKARGSGFRGRSDINSLYQIFSKIMQLEHNHADELVELAKDITVKIWDIPREMLEAQITPDVDINYEEDYQGDDEGEEPTDEINKRITLNSVTHGSAVHAMLTMHHLVDRAISEIDPRLLKLYNYFSSGSHEFYWLIDIPSILGDLAGMAVGSESVQFDGEMPVITAKAIMFPVLCQELSKGVAELITMHGLDGLDENTISRVLSAADDFKLEPYLIQIGPEVWRKILKVKPANVTLAELVRDLSTQTPSELHKIIDAVIDDPETAKRMLLDLTDDPSDFEVDQYDDGYEDDEEDEEEEDYSDEDYSDEDYNEEEE